MDFSKSIKLIEKKIETSKISIEAANKGRYEHFMLKEIMEEPIVLQRTLNKLISELSENPEVDSETSEEGE